MLNEEFLVKKLLPYIRKYVLETHDRRKMSISELARRLGITPTGLMKYRNIETIELPPNIRREIHPDLELIKEYLYYPNYNPIELRRIIFYLWIKWMAKGLFCVYLQNKDSLDDSDFHCDRLMEYYGKILIDMSIVEVEEAFEIYKNIYNIHKYVPEVSTNIVRLVEVGKDETKYPIIAFPGRIIRVNNEIKVFTYPKIGGSIHMGSILKKLYSMDHRFKGMTGIAYHRNMENIINKLGYSSQTLEVSHDAELLSSIKKASEVILDVGGIGREGFIYIAGYNSIDAVTKVRNIIEHIEK
jgi:predicted fused transcriptional regulator/phosphomethylpyrimidine kinase